MSLRGNDYTNQWHLLEAFSGNSEIINLYLFKQGLPSLHKDHSNYNEHTGACGFTKTRIVSRQECFGGWNAENFHIAINPLFYIKFLHVK